MGRFGRAGRRGGGRKQVGKCVQMSVRTLAGDRLELLADDGTVRICPKGQTCGALPGDRVLARYAGNNGAVVLRVIKRANEVFLGVLHVTGHRAAFEPLGRGLPRRLRTESGAESILAHTGAEDGDIVRARIVCRGGRGDLLVQIEERIGSLACARDVLKALVLSENLPQAFPEDALAQAHACKDADPAQDPGREDLRGLCLFTIDGRDAKDFDDAVSIEQIGDEFLLGVHIADVGYYVPQGSPLDREAYRRATSIYLPGLVLPMLPEPLSNGVCSLRPGEDKFALSALMHVRPSGEVVSLRLVRSIIRSCARLVYDDVNAMFAQDAQQLQRMASLGVKESLLEMHALSHRMRSRREARGSVDFEMGEPLFELDAGGEPIGITLRVQGEAERLIEEFMLAANEAVAALAKQSGLPLLYRVHEQPDPQKLADFARFLDRLGIPCEGLRERGAPADLRAVLEASRERPEHAAIASLALRSLRKARYDPRPLGHYALALEDYCHFTSPIRRYPDLVVSRALTAMSKHEGVTLTGEALEDAARVSSERERIAADAERAADKLMAARYMASHIGEVYEGTVSGIADYGFYVALGNGAEGVVYADSLGERWEMDEDRMRLRGERTGVTYSVGQTLRVRVTQVQQVRGIVQLELCAPQDGRARTGAQKVPKARSNARRPNRGGGKK